MKIFGYTLFEKKQKISSKDLLNLIPERKNDDIFLPLERVIKNYKPNLRTVLIIDDSRGITSILEEYISKNSQEEFNIVSFYGVNAPFIMEETLQILKTKGLTKIDFAIIDIVLPGKRFKDNHILKWDGIDVSIFLSEEFDLKNFLFYTGNIVSNYVAFIKDKKEKFNQYFKTDIKDFILYKSENDVIINRELNSLLTKEKYEI